MRSSPIMLIVVGVHVGEGLTSLLKGDCRSLVYLPHRDLNMTAVSLLCKLSAALRTAKSSKYSAFLVRRKDNLCTFSLPLQASLLKVQAVGVAGVAVGGSEYQEPIDDTNVISPLVPCKDGMISSRHIGLLGRLFITALEIPTTD